MKVAIVTGGSRGIGKSAALALAKRGTGVILTYHRGEREAKEVVSEIAREGGKAVALHLDAMDLASFPGFVDEVWQALSGVWDRSDFDFLVNNGGFAQRIPIADVTEEDFDALVAVHFKGPFFLTQKLLPMMASGGEVLFVSTGLTRVSGPYGVSVYAAVKGAVEVLTRYVAVEYADKGIRANCVAPGALDTEFGGGRTDEQRKLLAQSNLMGRVGVADDLGPVIATLLSDDCYWINAQRIEASGGARP